MRRHLVSMGCVTLLLLGAVCAWSAAGPPSSSGDPSPAVSPEGSSFKGTGVIAYYFHVNARYQTCLLIERRSDEVIRDAFGKEIREGSLAWSVVNTQQPGNRRFSSELGLPSRGLILVAYKDGTPGQWRNLEGVWQRVHGDPAGFQQYVSREVRAFLDMKP